MLISLRASEAALGAPTYVTLVEQHPPRGAGLRAADRGRAVRARHRYERGLPIVWPNYVACAGMSVAFIVVAGLLTLLALWRA